MKKRIISLILVVAMAFLTLTGCAYNYAKDDMTKYATFSAEDFFTALQALNIEDGDFGTDEAGRQNKVQDAIAQAILKVTDTTEKKYEGTLAAYDSLYYCYYATAKVDGVDHIFFASKMDESKASTIQLGLSSLEGLNKAISDALLSTETPVGDIKDHLYSTSATSVVGNGDAISISYNRTWTENGETKTDIKWNEYVVVNENGIYADLHKALIGMKVGEELDHQVTVNVTEGGVTTQYQYSNVKVESIALKSTEEAAKIKVADGNTVFLSYTMTFDAKPWYNETTKKYELPEGFDEANVDAEGKYKVTVSYTTAKVTADAEGTADDDKTFLGQLVGKEVGTTNSITVKKQTVGDKTVEVKYTGVKVNWIVNSVGQPIEIKYTPYTEALKDDNSNKKTETNIYGEKITLNATELTYYVLPVYYLDVADVSAELILREFASIVASTETAEHDHTEEEHEHETVYVFDTVNDTEYKNTEKNKTLATLVDELKALAKTYTEKEKARTDALKSLNTAQTKLAKGSSSDGEKATLQTTMDTAHTAYMTAHTAADVAEFNVNEKIKEILACKKGEAGVADALVADYKTYQYDTLADAYKAEITKSLATAIIKYLNTNVKFGDNLPKKAVKNAYKAIMNTYKYDFYEGKYSSGSSSSSSSTSTSTETNYAHYNGDFDLYLIDKVTSKKGDMDDVKKNIQKQAEDTVKDIIIIYVFANAVEDKWDADVTLTKDEKKEIKKNLEDTARLYQQYGLSFSYNVDDSYHAEQFDKAMNYLLEVSGVNEDTNAVEYKNIKYTVGSQEQ